MTPNGSWVVLLTVRALHAAGAQKLADASLWATSVGVRAPGPGFSIARLPDAADTVTAASGFPLRPSSGGAFPTFLPDPVSPQASSRDPQACLLSVSL